MKTEDTRTPIQNGKVFKRKHLVVNPDRGIIQTGEVTKRESPSRGKKRLVVT